MSINRTPHTWGTEEATSTLMDAEIKDLWTGLQAAFTSYTPTVGGGLTLGNGVLTAAYSRVGKSIDVRISLVLGTTSAIASNITISLPVAPIAGVDQSLSGLVVDASAGGPGRLPAAGFIPAGSSDMQVYSTGGSFTATSPFTWAATDKIIIGGRYEAA